MKGHLYQRKMTDTCSYFVEKEIGVTFKHAMEECWSRGKSTGWEVGDLISNALLLTSCIT